MVATNGNNCIERGAKNESERGRERERGGGGREGTINLLVAMGARNGSSSKKCELKATERTTATTVTQSV